MTPDLRYLSLGAGVQSSALYLMADRGELDSVPDVAIFADTQQEPPWVYENVERLRALGRIPIVVVSAGDLGSSISKSLRPGLEGRFVSIPFWVQGKDGNEAPGRRQCTREFKIDPIKRYVRECLGLKPRQRAAGKFRVEEWLGISLDELQRAKPSRDAWIQTRWPLIEKRMRRSDCEQFLKEIGFPVPSKSACVFCPYRGIDEWRRWQHSAPESFERACAWDEALRQQGHSARGLLGLQYISRTLTPLRLAVEARGHEREKQPDLFDDECDGFCGL